MSPVSSTRGGFPLRRSSGVRTVHRWLAQHSVEAPSCVDSRYTGLRPCGNTPMTVVGDPFDPTMTSPNVARNRLRTTAHERQRRDLDLTALLRTRHALR